MKNIILYFSSLFYGPPAVPSRTTVWKSLVLDEIEWLTLKCWLLVLSWLFVSFEITPAWFRMAGYGHSKTALNICFQKCATHRVVSGVSWCSKSSIVAKYSFCCILMSGCSLFTRFSVSTVGLDPSEQTTTGCKQPPFRFRSGFRYNRFTKCQINHNRNGISLWYFIWNFNEHH